MTKYSQRLGLHSFHTLYIKSLSLADIAKKVYQIRQQRQTRSENNAALSQAFFPALIARLSDWILPPLFLGTDVAGYQGCPWPVAVGGTGSLPFPDSEMLHD
jgi:hypothetical protein